MREPFPGEEPSGMAEKSLKAAGHKKWKLEPRDIEILRQALTEELDKRAKEWIDAFPNKPPHVK